MILPLDIVRLTFSYIIEPNYMIHPWVIQQIKRLGLCIFHCLEEHYADPKLARFIIKHWAEIIKSNADIANLANRLSANPDIRIINLVRSNPDSLSISDLCLNPNPVVIPLLNNIFIEDMQHIDYIGGRFDENDEYTLLSGCVHSSVVINYIEKSIDEYGVDSIDPDTISANPSEQIMEYLLETRPKLISSKTISANPTFIKFLSMNFEYVKFIDNSGISGNPEAIEFLKSRPDLINEQIYRNPNPDACKLYPYVDNEQIDQEQRTILISSYCSNLEYLCEHPEQINLEHLVDTNPLALSFLSSDQFAQYCPGKIYREDPLRIDSHIYKGRPGLLSNPSDKLIDWLSNSSSMLVVPFDTYDMINICSNPGIIVKRNHSEFGIINRVIGRIGI